MQDQSQLSHRAATSQSAQVARSRLITLSEFLRLQRPGASINDCAAALAVKSDSAKEASSTGLEDFSPLSSCFFAGFSRGLQDKSPCTCTTWELDRGLGALATQSKGSQAKHFKCISQCCPEGTGRFPELADHWLQRGICIADFPAVRSTSQKVCTLHVQ